MERRLEHRWQTEVYGSCQSERDQIRIGIAEISATGCRLNGNLSHLKVGDTVKITVANIGPLDATVRWSTADAAGVEFKVRLEQGVVAYFAAFCRIAA